MLRPEGLDYHVTYMHTEKEEVPVSKIECSVCSNFYEREYNRASHAENTPREYSRKSERS
jgi:hypothetical protein